MTWKEFSDSDLTFDEYISQLARDEVAKQTADIQPRLDALASAADVAVQTAEQRIAELEFDRLVRENAILGHVVPTTAKYFVRDAAELFELRDGILSPRNGQTQTRRSTLAAHVRDMAGGTAKDGAVPIREGRVVTRWLYRSRGVITLTDRRLIHRSAQRC